MHRGRDRRLAGVNLVDLAPVRSADWREVDGHAVVERPPPAGGPLARLADRLASLGSVPRLRLDEAGTFVWLRLDGRRTVGEIAVAMREQLGGAYEPAEERIAHLVQLLRRERMVALPGFDGAVGGTIGSRREG